MLRATCLWSSAVLAFPLVQSSESTSTEASSLIQPRSSLVPIAKTRPPVEYGEATYARTIYTVVSLLCMFLLAALLGARGKQLRIHNLKTMNLIRFIVLLLNFLAIAFVISVAVLEIGLGLSTAPVCRSAVITCLSFYVANKVIMYVLLVERAHAMRSVYVSRRKDWIWLSGMLIVGIGFGTIAIVAFIWPISDMSEIDGKCRIGLPLKATVPLLSYDAALNFGLTFLFIYLLKPLLSFGGLMAFPASPSDRIKRQDYLHPMNTNFLKSIKMLLWKSVIGSILVSLPTITNVSLLFSMKGRELGWLCFVCCTLDVTWAVCVLHWLTVDPAEVDGTTVALLVKPDSTSSASSAGGAKPS
ncbi:uncharacterized protein BDZ99DRAFT_384865 [Mytilinidion resinicola]|uniref:Uncharacterized protein n=1 Tax=Mytilinidion resinicola TaxID=574789 RepID=A0A6A6YU84_9PEZI|nr:uncharacterized protein BDZ99DRAFT_384865 [Mytilinidion resinicola]KAF2811487.1 hypothetical protein BDZ99DRAFT_384865 [Mytilinidion resinicola]